MSIKSLPETDWPKAIEEPVSSPAENASPVGTRELGSFEASLESLLAQSSILTASVAEQGTILAQALAVIAERMEKLESKLGQFENRLAPPPTRPFATLPPRETSREQGKGPEPRTAKDAPATNLLRVENADLPTDNTRETFQEFVRVAPSGQTPKGMGSSFYRGENCNFNPYGADHASPSFCRDFVLRGWLPESKIISKTTRVTAFGSCFAQNITAHLARLGFDLSKNRAPEIYVSAMGEGLVNVHALLQQFTWTLEGEQPPENLWHGYNAKSFGYDESVREKTREVFLNTDVFILTLGLSEVWYDEVTGGIFWRAVPMRSYDPSRHKFRVCTFAETKQALQRMHAIITKNVPSARIVFTLSPIPLAATFRKESCLTANCTSKAILRAALDEFLRELGEAARSKVHYFPAFEIINELFPHRFVEDGRHPHDFIIPAVMKLFEAYYCDSGASVEEAESLLQTARLRSTEMASIIYR